MNEARLKHEPIRFSIAPAHVHDLGNSAVAIDASDVHDHVNRERDRLAGISMREADIRRQDAMRKARECLLSRVRMDCAHAPKMAGVEGLKKVERFSAAYLANENTVWSMPECRAADRKSTPAAVEPRVQVALGPAWLPAARRLVCPSVFRRFPQSPRRGRDLGCVRPTR